LFGSSARTTLGPTAAAPTPAAPTPAAPTTAIPASPALALLRATDPDTLSPRAALDLLFRLRDLADDDETD
jgi:hypothetical protein